MLHSGSLGRMPRPSRRASSSRHAVKMKRTTAASATRRLWGPARLPHMGPISVRFPSRPIQLTVPRPRTPQTPSPTVQRHRRNRQLIPWLGRHGAPAPSCLSRRSGSSGPVHRQTAANRRRRPSACRRRRNMSSESGGRSMTCRVFTQGKRGSVVGVDAIAGSPKEPGPEVCGQTGSLHKAIESMNYLTMTFNMRMRLLS